MQPIAMIFAVGLFEKIRAWSAAQNGIFQTLVFFGVVAVIALVVFGWALMVRDKPKAHHHRQRSKTVPAMQSGEKQAAGRESRPRRKHRRRAHRPVNPTLAQTGGLPAPRDGTSPPSV